MKFRRQRREEPAINLTPLIDVVFLLLIFFMVTTTFTRDTRLIVNLPEAEGAPAQDEPEQIEVVIDQNGSYAVGGRALINAEIDTLINALHEVSEGRLDTPLVLLADAEATHQNVITAMDGIGQAGFSQFSIATRQSAADGQAAAEQNASAGSEQADQ